MTGELPYGWVKKIDEATGTTVFWDSENDRTTFTDPRLAFATEEKNHKDDFRQRFDSSSTAFQVANITCYYITNDIITTQDTLYI